MTGAPRAPSRVRLSLLPACALLALAACDSHPCRQGTAYLTLQFDAASSAADQVRVQVSIAGASVADQTRTRTPDATSNDLELDFASYPAGQQIALTVTALRGGNQVGAGTLTATLLDGCSALLVKVSAAGDAGMVDAAAGDSGHGDGALSDGAASDASDGGGGLVVTPSARNLLVNASLQMAATLGGQATSAVIWSVVDANGGSVSSAGLYTAPQQEGTYAVRATDMNDASVHTDAAITVVRLLTPSTMASAGTLANSSGEAQSTHLVYARNAKQWWLFYDSSDATNQMLTAWSSDFMTWSAAASATLPSPHGNDGRNLTVAYRAFGNSDVVHISQGTNDGNGNLTRYHLRGTLAPGAASFGAVVEQNTGGGEGIDGPAVVILSDGTVIDGTGWEATPSTPPISPCGVGDADIYEADHKETGTTDFDMMTWTERVLWCVPGEIQTRALIELAGAAYFFFEENGNGNSPILMNVRQTDYTWLPYEPPNGPEVRPPAVFAQDVAYPITDWSVVASGGKLHAVRRLADGTSYQHRVYDPSAGSWNDGLAIPDEPGRMGDGVVLVPYADCLLLFALANDASSSLRMTAYNGTGWSTWITVATATNADRHFLSAASGDHDHAAVIWSQTNMNSYDLDAVLLP